MLDELSYQLIDQSSHDVSLPRSNWPTARPRSYASSENDSLNHLGATRKFAENVGGDFLIQRRINLHTAQ